MDSLIQIVTTAGAVALIFLVVCLVSRIQREPGNRGIFQRMPVILPAFAFVISVFLILQMGILPMSIYKGGNHTVYSAVLTNESMSFTVYDSDIAYVDDIGFELHTNIGTEEYLLLHIEFIQNAIAIETLNLNLTEDSMVPDGKYIDTVNLDSGRYSISVNGSLYNSGLPQGNINYLDLVLYQAIQPSFQPEIVDWSSYQFFVNIVCIVFILAGLCIGRVDHERTSEENIDQEPSRGDNYIRPFH